MEKSNKIIMYYMFAAFALLILTIAIIGNIGFPFKFRQHYYSYVGGCSFGILLIWTMIILFFMLYKNCIMIKAAKLDIEAKRVFIIRTLVILSIIVLSLSVVLGMYTMNYIEMFRNRDPSLIDIDEAIKSSGFKHGLAAYMSLISFISYTLLELDLAYGLDRLYKMIKDNLGKLISKL